MKITEEQKEEMKKLRAEGMTLVAVGKKFGIASSSVMYHTDDKARKKYIDRIAKRSKEQSPEIKALVYDRHRDYMSEYHKRRYKEDPEFRERKKLSASKAYLKRKAEKSSMPSVP